ncbi:MAG: hypothetical protein AMJ46_03680 [Latescibacteria bacterium DG_63]|nr:MAG: hypothetical protein AMJ46_03680 [Latescibacteria bacterium DG_63]
MKRIVIIAMLSSLAAWCLAEAADPPIDCTVYQIQRAADYGIAVGDSVRITDVVVTALDIRPNTHGFWVQEQPGSDPLYPYYSGIAIYTQSTFPTGVQLGDIMTVKGVYAEYGPGSPDTCRALSEIDTVNPLTWEKTGSTTVPEPILLSAYDVGDTCTTCWKAEKWEGVLVTLDTLVCTSYDAAYPLTSWWCKEAHNHPPSTSADSFSVQTNKLIDPYPGRPNIGDTLVSVTGIHQYAGPALTSPAAYRIITRNAADIVYKGSGPAPNLILAYSTSNTEIVAAFDSKLDQTTAENTLNYSLGTGTLILGAVLDPVERMSVTLTTGTQVPGTWETLTVCCIKSEGGASMIAAQDQSFRAGLTPISLVQTPKSAENDSSQFANEQVTIAGIVTGDKNAYVEHFFMEQTPGGPWSGIMIYGGIPIIPAEGDSVIVAGLVSEYYNRTELLSVDYIEVVSSGNPIPGPDLVDPDQINTGSPTGESYEGVFVRCDPVFVSDTTGYEAFGQWTVSNIAAHTATVGHSASYTYDPTIGEWMNIRGPMDYYFGIRRIEPRRDADIDLVNVTGVDPGTQPKPQVFALEQNSPNPFNPVTNIFFSIPAKAKVELYVYDVSGRVVKKLVDGVPMEPGRHKATWDGRNDAGRAVSSGVYFCKLSAADKVAQMKMVVLK